jgi:hypothetical protein
MVFIAFIAAQACLSTSAPRQVPLKQPFQSADECRWPLERYAWDVQLFCGGRPYKKAKPISKRAAARFSEKHRHAWAGGLAGLPLFKTLLDQQLLYTLKVRSKPEPQVGSTFKSH